MNKQFTVVGITFQEDPCVSGEEDIILLSPFQYAALESLLYTLLKDSLGSVLTDEKRLVTEKKP